MEQMHQKGSNSRPGHKNKDHLASFGYIQVPEHEKVKWVRRHFDTVARQYDFMNTLLSFGIHHLWKRTAINMMKLKKGDLVLDVCGGTGDLSLLAAAKIGFSGKVFLYDINRMMMKRGQGKVRNSVFNENIFFIQGDAEQISFPDGSLDAATIGFGIRNLTHMELGFKEIYRILKPGGRFMCLEFSRPTAAWFRWVYDMYSFTIMPLLGQIITGSRKAYTYLPESIRLFPQPDELADTLGSIGFSNISYRRLTNGIAVAHLASKNH